MKKKTQFTKLVVSAKRKTLSCDISKEIEAEREELSNILDCSPAMIFYKDKENRYVRVNKILADSIGLPKEQIEGKRLEDLLPEQAEHYWQDDQEVIASGRPKTDIIEIFETKIGPRWVKTDKFPYKDNEGNVIGIIGFAIDITERKRAEDELYRRDAIISAESFAAGEFLKALTWEQNIQEVLEKLGQATEVSRVYIFENRQGPEGEVLASQRYEWTAPGIAPQIENPALQNLSFSGAGFGSWQELLARGEIAYGKVKDMPEKERLFLSAEDIRSIVLVPIFVGEKWWGFFGFDDCTIERDWSSAEIHALRTMAGTLGAAIGRKEADRALRESEERFRIATELANDLIYEWDIKRDKIEYYSDVEGKFRRGSHLFPKTFEEKRKMIHTDDCDRVVASVERHLETGEPFSSEYRIGTGNGDYIFVAEQGIAFWDDKGEPYKWIGVMTDMTERKKAEDEIAGWKQRYDMIVASSGQVIYDYDIKTGKIVWGGSVERVLGYNSAEIDGGIDQWAGLIHPEERGEALRLLDVSKRNFLPYDVEYRFKNRGGEYIWIHDRGFFIADVEGKVARMLGTMQDVTLRKRSEEDMKHNKERLEEWSRVLEDKVEERTRELKKYQEMLVRQEKMAVLGQVSASISHELRTPLTGIKNSVYFLQTLGVEKHNPKIADHISLINMEVDVCVRVINNMLDFVRPKEPIKKLSRLESIVNESLGSSVLPSRVKVKTDFQKDLPMVMMDPFQMRQVFDNIVKNAFDAMAMGGELTVTVKAEVGQISIEFKDTGMGIAPDSLNKIFDPLYSTTPTGVGLGLTIVRQFVEAHGGGVEVKSELGKGSIFTVRLPLR